MEYMHVAWKTVITFLLLWGLTRLLGKEQVGQLTMFDYITGITIGSLAANAVTPVEPILPLLLSVALWAFLSFLFHMADLKSTRMEQVLDGQPVVVIRHGVILEEELRRQRVTVAHLSSLLRQKGFFDLQQVEFAILETNGQLSVLPRSQYRPIQPRDLHVSTGYEGLPLHLIHEGRMLSEGLRKAGLSEQWLQTALARQGISDPGEVFAAWLATDGSLVVDRYYDGVH